MIQQAQSQRSLEERLAPKIDQGEYLLVLVLALMLWIAGFVDLFTHASQEPQVLGLYSWPYFLFLIMYSLGFVFWGLLIFPADSLTWFKKGIHFFQTNTLAGLVWFGVSAALILSMFIWERWTSFPLLETSLAVLTLLLSTVILIMRPSPGEPIRPFHKGMLFLFGAVISVEAVLQILSFAGILPLPNYEGLFTSYGRVYQAEEGLTNSRMNKFGLYYPEFRLGQDSRKIFLVGDSLVQGLQVSKDELFGVLLDQQLNQNASDEDIEVLSLGLPGYGPGLYLNTPLYPYTLEPLQPSEIVVFFHLANDFQTISGPGQPIPYFVIDSSGKINVAEQDFARRHDLQHLIIRGFEPINPVQTVASHLFLFGPVDGLIQRLTGRLTRVPMPVLNFEQTSPEQPLGAASFVFSDQPDPRAESSWAVAEAQLDEFFELTAEKGVTVRLVTIPYFPAEFYNSSPNEGWEGRLGSYDLLLPEKRLQAFAQERGIPFLGLGEYLQSANFSLDEVQALFLKEGTGHFSPSGHAFVAEALLNCFYSSTVNCPASGP
jgi:hypothetical protein